MTLNYLPETVICYTTLYISFSSLHKMTSNVLSNNSLVISDINLRLYSFRDFILKSTHMQSFLCFEHMNMKPRNQPKEASKQSHQ